jgi:diguanylate cyclase (GGDEF)-like protein
MRHAYARLLFACALCLGLAAFARATPPVDVQAGTRSLNLAPAAGVVVDPAGALTPAEARARAFADPPLGVGEAVNLGYGVGTAWLRVVLNVAPNAPEAWFLEIGYPSLDHVDLYQHGPAGMTAQHAGDRNPGGAMPYPHHNLVFPLRLTPGTNQELLLRVRSEGNLTVPITLWQPDALARADRREYSRHALYYGALLALLLYNLLLYLSVRDPLYLLYCGMVAGMGIGQVSLNGYGNLWLWPGSGAWGHWALPWGFALCGLAGALFTRRFLDTPRYAPGMDRWVGLFMALFALLTVLGPPVMPYAWVAIGVSLAGLGFSFLAVAVGIKTYLAGSPGARYFLLAWTLLLTGVAVMAARNLGWLPTNWWTLNLMQIGSALEMLLLSLALADRINILARDKASAQAEAMRAKEDLLVALRGSEARMNQRVLESTAELRAANEKLRANEEHMRQLALHDPLTGLANRKLLDEEMAHALARARRAGAALGIAFVDLDGFKAINDRHGHDVGDEVLRAVARLLLEQVRAGDVVARLGGDEFVLVLEHAGTRADLRRRIDYLTAALRFDLPLPGSEAAHVAASVGLALFPEDGEDAARLLRVADEAMYRVKHRLA